MGSRTEIIIPSCSMWVNSCLTSSISGTAIQWGTCREKGLAVSESLIAQRPGNFPKQAVEICLQVIYIFV